MMLKGENSTKSSVQSKATDQVPLSVAFLWHMHQPYYKDAKTGQYQMPWVRLHGLKDYYDMAAILDEFPSIRQTFNLVPSLVEQIEDYATNQVYDEHLFLTEKPALNLTDTEKEKILAGFFNCNPSTMINPYPRFYQLWEKRGNDLSDIKNKIRDFKTQDYLDLQVWSNLVWIDPIFRKDALIFRLMKKRENYTEEDKGDLLLKQREIMGKILPKYKQLQDRGQIEVSLSPYFHPILPLLYDTGQARSALPGIPLPLRRFSHPEDVETQIEMGRNLYEKTFGKKPKGMWPSEGSVSETILPLVVKAGINWIATDEEILYLSLLMKKEGKTGNTTTRGLGTLYKPYQITVGDKDLSILFRDHTLSDLIGFVYSNWDANQAANDFIQRLRQIRKNIPQNELSASVVAVILDGENCWEYYRNDGHDFLAALYTKLSEDPLLRTTTFSDFLESPIKPQKLSRLFAGSWINHNFRIWIGHPEDNLAWDLLSKTRDALVDFDKRKGHDPENEKILQSAWREIYISEGSDWNWWYGDEHQADGIEEFDRMFRSHLLYVFELIGADPPEELYQPIKSMFGNTYFLPPTGYVKPVIDGERTHYYEWQQAGFFAPLKAGGAMHQAFSLVVGIYFGTDDSHLYFRIDPSISKKEFEEGKFGLILELVEPSRYKIIVNGEKASLLKRTGGSEWKEVSPGVEFVFKKIMELAVPINLLEFDQKRTVQFLLIGEKQGKEMERWPKVDTIQFDLPSQKKDLIFWEV